MNSLAVTQQLNLPANLVPTPTGSNFFLLFFSKRSSQLASSEEILKKLHIISKESSPHALIMHQGKFFSELKKWKQNLLPVGVKTSLQQRWLFLYRWAIHSSSQLFAQRGLCSTMQPLLQECSGSFPKPMPYEVRDVEWAGLSEWATGLERAPLMRLWDFPKTNAIQGQGRGVSRAFGVSHRFREGTLNETLRLSQNQCYTRSGAWSEPGFRSEPPV